MYTEPTRMLEAARQTMRYETFGSSGLMPTEAFTVRLKNRDDVIAVPASMSMLDALNRAGYEVMSDCERGECGVCDVFFSDHQKQQNTKMCACVSRAIGTATVDTLYRQDAV